MFSSRRTAWLAVVLMLIVGFGLSASRAAPQLTSIEFLTYWPDKVEENSGLARWGGFVWTINDSGGRAAVYAFDDQQFSYRKRVDIAGAKNIDWESLAQDETYLYIADCGNNLSHRPVMQIYRVRWEHLLHAKHKNAVSFDQRQRFSFNDRPAQPIRGQNNFDCEAITRVGDQLWLFSKNHDDRRSRLYQLDLNARSQIVAPILELPVNGMITAADYNPHTGQLALLGYQKSHFFGRSFLWVMPVSDNRPDWSKAVYYTLQPFGQWEALVWEDAHTLLLSAEKNPFGRQQIGRIRLLE